jgi:hypothetical protein
MDELPPVKLSELKEKIVTDEIMEYKDMKVLNSLVLGMKKATEESYDQFKDVILPLVDELIRLSGDHMLVMYKSDIVSFINKNPKVIVDSLILKCYEENDGVLRAKIVSGDESFFLKNNFDDMTDGDSKIINIIFKFKDFWGKLDENNKEILKSYLLSIVALCDIRYLNYKKFICLKKMNPKFEQVFSQFGNNF